MNDFELFSAEVVVTIAVFYVLCVGVLSWVLMPEDKPDRFEGAVDVDTGDQPRFYTNCACCGTSSFHVDVELVDLQALNRRVPVFLCDVCVSRGIVDFSEYVVHAFLVAHIEQPRLRVVSAEDLAGVK